MLKEKQEKHCPLLCVDKVMKHCPTVTRVLKSA